MACRHELLWRAVSVTLEPGVESIHVRDGRSFFVADAKRCVMGCGEWLPLGPATDTAETAIEVRAAELALKPTDGRVYFVNLDEAHGWHDYEDDRGGECSCRTCQVRNRVHNWDAGWLAHTIANHATEHGEG